MYEIVGFWSGYTSSQRSLQHREYTSDKEFADKVRALGFIRYTDGTTLDLRVREVSEKNEKEKHGYSDLIRSCVRHGVASVADLPKRATP